MENKSNTSKLKPGPIQRKWLKSLREYPDSQLKGQLGEIQPDGTYKACCLGELCLLAGKGEWKNGCLFNNFSAATIADYKKLGLYDPSGYISGTREVHNLAIMNDSTNTWPEIADFVEANFDKVFTKSY